MECETKWYEMEKYVIGAVKVEALKQFSVVGVGRWPDRRGRLGRRRESLVNNNAE